MVTGLVIISEYILYITDLAYVVVLRSIAPVLYPLDLKKVRTFLL